MRSMMTGLVAAVLFAGPPFLYGQDAPKKEEPKAAVEAVLAEFTGTVDVKKAGENDWVPAEKGMKLKEGSEVCTGYSSTAVLDFGGNIKVDVSSLSNMKIDLHALKGKKADTTLKVEFGQIELDVKKGEIESNVKVSTPNSTTSISGTRVAVRCFSDEVPRGGGAPPQHATVRVSQGTVSFFSNVTGTAMAVTEGEVTTTEMVFAQEVERIFEATSTPPLIGATTEELGLTSSGTSQATFDTGSVGVVVGGDLTSDSSPIVGERIVARQVPVLPGPPPMPGAVAKPK